MGTWSEYEQEELARQAEWLRREREPALVEPVKPSGKPPILSRFKKLFGSKE